MPMTPENWQRRQAPNVATNAASIPTIASATSIDLSLYPWASIVRITGTTDIANIKPPSDDFSGEQNFLFDGASPPDFISGGSPAAGYFAVALTKSMVRYEVVRLWFDPGTSLWYPSMT